MARIHLLVLVLTAALPGCTRVLQSPGDAAPPGRDVTPPGRDAGLERSGRADAPDLGAGPDGAPRDAPFDRAAAGEPLPPGEAGAGPVVALVSPPAGISTPALEVLLVFTVTSAAPIASCQLVLDGQMRNVGVVAGVGTTAATVTDGAHVWGVTCVDTLNRAGSAGPASFLSEPIPLAACKASGWQAGTKYRLATDLLDVKGDCFVIDAAKVKLDGGGRVVSSAKRKDIVLSRWDAKPVIVEANQLSSGMPALFQPIWSSPYATESMKNATLADVDDDGDLDLIVASQKVALRVFLNAGQGQFGAASSWQTAGAYEVTRVLDVDHDGSLDLLLGQYGGAEELFLGNGSGQSFSSVWKAALGTYTRELELGDFNRDGWIDLVTGSNVSADADDRHHLALNAIPGGAGAGFATAWVSDGKSDRGGAPTLVADFDGDGLDDLFLGRDAADNDKASYVRLNNGKGTGFSETLALMGTLPFAAADLDADGDTDILVSSFDAAGNAVAIASYLNDGKGAFASAWKVLFTSAAIGAAALADLNGDGLPDLVLGPAAKGESLTAFLNVGNGQFKSNWSSSLFEYAPTNGIEAADLDHDGDLDLAITWVSGAPAYSVLLNDGTGGFKPVWTGATSAGDSLVALVAGDLDGPPAVGVRLNPAATGAQVLGFASLRGFTTGVEVSGADGVALSDITVESPDLHGVRVQNVTKVVISKLALRHFRMGVGLRLVGVQTAVVDGASLCPQGRDRRLTAVSASCVKVGLVAGVGNRLALNNGCVSGLVWSACP